MKLSVIVPCYNESRTLRQCIERVLEIADESLSLEVVIVDDCSTDESPAIARELEQAHSQIVLVTHEKNQGKGAALRNGIKKATGDFVAVQDADLEYDPNDLKRILAPLVKGDADVVLRRAPEVIVFDRAFLAPQPLALEAFLAAARSPTEQLLVQDRRFFERYGLRCVPTPMGFVHYLERVD